MKIVVLVKEVPDTFGDRRLSLETGLADRSASDAVLDEIAERSIEAAMSWADAGDGVDVVLVAVGPGSAEESLRKGLAMGATSAVHIVDDELHGADLGLTAEVLAAAVKRIGFDLVIAGNLSTDGMGGVIPAMVAELLGVPQLTNLTSMVLEEDMVWGTRATEFGAPRVSSELPALVSITEAFPDARFPNFKGILAAKKKPIERLSLADLAVDPGATSKPRSIMIALSERPLRAAGVKIVDEGDAGRQLATFLIENRLAGRSA
jgi:electron transfer flavoprotein beta subunit